MAGAPWRSKARPRTPSPAAATSAAAPGRLKPSSARYRTTHGGAGGHRWRQYLRAAQRQDARRHRHRLARPRPGGQHQPARRHRGAHRLQPGQHSRHSQLFAVNNRPDAAYIVATDRASRASGPTCPATTCSTCCARPAACREPRRATRSAPAALAGSRLGSWDALIPPGAKFLTPSASPSAWATASMNRRPCPTRSWPPPASASWRSTATTTRS